MRAKDKAADALATSRLRVGAAIRQTRQAAGLSLAELAGRVGIALSTMSKIENGKISTSFERLENIGAALDTDMTALIGTSSAAAPAQVPAASRPAFGTRRSVTRADDAQMVDAGTYLEFFHASDMLHKRFQPIVAEILLTDIADYGPYTQHTGEEFNYILEGELEFHCEAYAPVRLTAGSSIYFDAEMKHAHIKVGSAPCRILAILCPRGEPAAAAAPGARLRVVGAGTSDTIHGSSR